MVLIDLGSDVSVLLAFFILFNSNHIENLNKWIFVGSFQRVELFVCRDLFLRFSNPHSGVVTSKCVLLCEIAVAVSAYLSEHHIVFNVLSLFSFRFSALPRFPYELKHNEEDEELDEDNCEHVYQELSL